MGGLVAGGGGGEGGRSSLVSVSDLKILRPWGLIPWLAWAGRGTSFFFCHPRVNSCARVKDLISICRKKSRPHSRWCGHTKILHTLG